MPVELSQSLVIGISSRALFNLERENEIFVRQGLEAYSRYQLEHEHEILQPGAGFRLIDAILRLNARMTTRRLAEVIIMSRNASETSFRIFRSIDHHKLDIRRAALAGGASLAPYLNAFQVDLYLTTYEEDVRQALDAGIAAAVIYPTPPEAADPIEEIRIAFDGDAVLFSDEAERIYQAQGLEAFMEHERAKAQEPLPDGPFAKLLRTLHILQKDPCFPKPPIRTALVTARGMPSHHRVLTTLRAWDVHVDEAFFLGGLDKTAILQAFKPHIFFDDQEVHCERAVGLVSTARVPAAWKDDLAPGRQAALPRSPNRPSRKKPKPGPKSAS
jgi:5'-nucleotidase